MVMIPPTPIRRQSDIAAFEREMPLDQRLPERSVLDVFIGATVCAGPAALARMRPYAPSLRIPQAPNDPWLRRTTS